MKQADMIARLRKARALVREIYEGTDIPQIQSILRHADQNLHWALWNLGEIDGLRPDLPDEPAPKKKPAAKKPRRRKS